MGATTGTLRSDVEYYFWESFALDNGKTLTIQPGSIIKIKNGKQFNVNGNLQAVGTSANPIIFTSYNDDSVGGTAPGSTGTPVKGAWEYIYFSGGGSNGSVLEYTQIKYGGGNGNYGAINMYSSNATIKNTTIIGSKYSGIYMYNSSPKVVNSIIVSSGQYGIQNNSGSPTITYSLFYNNTSGASHGVTLDATNIVGQDPLLNLYGGIYIPQAGSPAINHGDPSYGNDPVSGNSGDIGAYEYLGPLPNFVNLTYSINITQVLGRNLDYEWGFVSVPDGISPPSIYNRTGLIKEDGQVYCSFKTSKTGTYQIKISIKNAGVSVGEFTNSFKVGN